MIEASNANTGVDVTELTVPLAERVEYASSGWIDEARRYLGRRADGTPSFSIAVALDNAPPHLDDDERRPFGYTIRVGGGRADVESTPDPAAQLRVRTDYNAALPFAWAINGDTESAERAHREYAFILDRPQIDGRLPDDPAIGILLSAFHDHMAWRTVNNPDVRHRAKHLGLDGNLADLDDKGYTVLPNAFTDELAEEMRDEAHRNHDAAPPDTGFRATMLLRRGRLWEYAAVHPWVLTLAEYLLGRGCVMYQSDTIIKGPGLDTHPGLHADYGASRVAEPFPEYCLEATAVWAIDDFDRAAGPTVIVPGSFRNRRQVPPGTTREDVVTIEMPKGSIAFWHGASWHGAMPRTAPGTRTSLHNAYVRFFMRPLERYDDVDQAIVDRNPPVFSTLCGLDDIFGKSGDTGADFERMRYASEAGYGRTEL